MVLEQLVTMAKESGDEKIPAKLLNKRIVAEGIKKHPEAIQFLPEEFITRSVATDAVMNNAMLIEYVSDQTEALQLEAVKDNGIALSVCKNPSYRVMKEAIKSTPEAMLYVNDFKTSLTESQYLDLAKHAVVRDGLTLEYFYKDYAVDLIQDASVHKRHVDICMTAIKENFLALKFVPNNIVDEVQEVALEVSPSYVVLSAKPPKKYIEKLLKQDPKYFLSLEKELFKNLISKVDDSVIKELSKTTRMYIKMKKYSLDNFLVLLGISAFIIVLLKVFM